MGLEAREAADLDRRRPRRTASSRSPTSSRQQTVASLAAAGWDVSVEDLFDTTIIDEIYEENPELKDYLP